MGLLEWLGFNRGLGIDELARRLDMPRDLFLNFSPVYREFTISKRGGGKRQIMAPEQTTKALQRRLLRRVLARLSVHPSAHGFERGRSIVTNASPHVGQEVVIRLDLVKFFRSTRAYRVQKYLRRIGWNRQAAELITRLCTWDGALPEGAPTSPRLSNLVNYRLDSRIAGMAAKLGAVYTRYADDITLSFAENDEVRIHSLRRFVRQVVEEEGYQVHRRKKASVRRRNKQQLVTGLVVNEKVNLPRRVRRWLRAVEHRARDDWRSRPLGASEHWEPPQNPTLTPEQLAGWRALRNMVER